LWNALGYSSGAETPYDRWPTAYMPIADGKIYVSNGEHSPNQPLYRGHKLYCIEANTGDVLWHNASYCQSPIIADGYLMTFNGYDMQNYAFGKGLSATTVQTPLTGIHAGDTFAIAGTVTDQSPRQTCLGIPAAGTPAISDDSMSAWMEYLYMQKTKPDNATGVPVSVVAISSDGTVTDIGQATSDNLGTYGLQWTAPNAPGVYKIYANFAGTNSYYPSEAEAIVTVVGAIATPASASDVANEVVSKLPTPIPATPAPTMPRASDVTNNVVSQLPSVSTTDMAIIAVLAFVFVVGLVNLVFLTRKK
jgi:hypothetical protein